MNVKDVIGLVVTIVVGLPLGSLVISSILNAMSSVSNSGIPNAGAINGLLSEIILLISVGSLAGVVNFLSKY